MAVIYIGSIYPQELVDELKQMGSSVDFAAETFQTSLLHGLSEFYHDIKVITAPNISSYPKINKKIFERKEFRLPFNDIKHVFVGFVNIPILKHISKLIRIKRVLNSLLDNNSDNKILIYGVHSPFLLALCGISKKRYKSCLIVPDLPEYMSGNKKMTYLLGKKIDSIFINIGLNRINSFVLFSSHMREKLNIGNNPFTQIEGIFFNDINSNKVEKEDHKTILYTGSLSKRYGILDLVQAFRLIEDENYELLICGGGDALSEIEKIQKSDNRIKYLGLLTKEEVRKLQKRATLLVNPRHKTDEYTKYSFPSKTMEYMASGTPTLMSHLASIPKEYEEHIYFFDDESIEGMKNKIVEICEKTQSELDAFGKAASEFILTEKNEKKQAKKIVELFERI